jgi:hypothetical protein
MASLSRDMRRDLERVVKDARRVAELGARKALKELAVQEYEPARGLSPDQRRLRNRLRAHGRQLGDRRDEKRGSQEIDRLASECAYEHWHRLLFARFLAECHLLIEPATGVAISLDECRELALERRTDWLLLASSFAERMLPQIFRAGDPALEVTLPPESRQKLEELLKSLPSEVFTADDSLGWVYQFWQAERKRQVNDSGAKIGADELAAVTQLFTEDYMVLFLLHNTLGAWWSAKRRAEGKDAALPGYEWTYLRLHDDGTPVAGTFDGWPQAAKDLKVLDPCMGSGHFLVFALPILVAFRMGEEALTRAAAVDAVLRENLFGLELDGRCTQIAAFNLALSAWRMVGHRPLPTLNLACSGLGVNAVEGDWVSLAGDDTMLRGWMHRLYRLFARAPSLGSLIDPKRAFGEIFVTQFPEVRQLLDKALNTERGDDEARELAIAAQGLVQAARTLSDTFTLVATNVPYLGRGDQEPHLAEYCEEYHPTAKADLATCFVERCLRLCAPNGVAALVTPQNWLFLHSYKAFRHRFLSEIEWNLLGRLGPRAFETITGEVVKAAMLVVTQRTPAAQHRLAGLDVSSAATPAAKAAALRTDGAAILPQSTQLQNPDSRVSLAEHATQPTLALACDSFIGLGTGDYSRYGRCFWEFPREPKGWTFQQGSVKTTAPWAGREHMVAWDASVNRVRGMSDAERVQIHNQDQSGQQAWGSAGVAVSLMGDLKCTLYTGERHEKAVAALIPRSPALLPALWTFCSDSQFRKAVRQLDQKVIVANGTLVKVPFDQAHWQREAETRLPSGLPKPQSAQPTQWLFAGHPRGSTHPLQVAVARLVGYSWPRQSGSAFPDCPALGSDGLEHHADEDGIVCLPSLKGEAPAVDRLRDLLAEAFGADWSPSMQATLLSEAKHPGEALGRWLTDAFFEEHCELFHQRPFVWHVWDGLNKGFSALVNYHRLAALNGEGRRTLEKLIYSYLGDWIQRQRDEQRAGTEGADARVAAAVHLKRELERILEGEPPYDVFVRWKPLYEQPIGWAPDVDDGVRANIRPFLIAKPLSTKSKSACILRSAPKINWDKDRGNDPERPREDFPWSWGWDESSEDFPGRPDFDGSRWNDLHYTRAFKLAARKRRALWQEARAR